MCSCCAGHMTVGAWSCGALQYRTFFLWIVQMIQKLDKDDAQPPSATPPPALDVLVVARFPSC